MSDLISREVVINIIHNYFKSLIDKTVFEIDVVDCAKGVSEVINSIPTAYNVDEVVEQLKEYGRYIYDVVSTEKAIEIVKGAAKDER